jgi:hypothetical protein
MVVLSNITAINPIGKTKSKQLANGISLAHKNAE